MCCMCTPAAGLPGLLHHLLMQRLVWLQGGGGGSRRSLQFCRHSPETIGIRFTYDLAVKEDLKTSFPMSVRTWDRDKKHWVFPAHLKEEVKAWARKHFEARDITLLPEVRGGLKHDGGHPCDCKHRSSSGSAQGRPVRASQGC